MNYLRLLRIFWHEYELSLREWWLFILLIYVALGAVIWEYFRP